MTNQTNDNPPAGVPLPQPRIRAFEDLAAGLFLHWGLYSLLGRGEWVMSQEAIPHAEYSGLIGQFTASGFDAREWAVLARRAGLRYACLTARHHEGFSLYDTRGLSDYDAPNSPAGRDLVAEFVDACREADIVPFLYHTTLDWSRDSQTCDAGAFREYLGYLRDSVEVLCRHYGPIGGLWFDGNWSRTDLDWEEDRLYRMIRQYQPEAMIINNTGLSARGATGHPEIDSVTFEQDLPVEPDRVGWPKYLAGEMCKTLNVHWGHASGDFNYRGLRDVIEDLCNCRRAGANMLLNVGPLGDGSVPAYEAGLLNLMGRWIEAHPEAIRNARPTACICPGRDFVLRAGQRFYYFAFGIGGRGSGHVVLQEGSQGARTIRGLPATIRSIRWLDSAEALPFVQEPHGRTLTFEATGYPYGTNRVVRIACLEA